MKKTDIKIIDEVILFFDRAIDEDIVMFYNKFIEPCSMEEFLDLDDEDKEFVRDEIIRAVEKDFDNDMVLTIKMFQIINLCMFDGVTDHKTPRFKFKKLSDGAAELFLKSEGITYEV